MHYCILPTSSACHVQRRTLHNNLDSRPTSDFGTVFILQLKKPNLFLLFIFVQLTIILSKHFKSFLTISQFLSFLLLFLSFLPLFFLPSSAFSCSPHSLPCFCTSPTTFPLSFLSLSVFCSHTHPLSSLVKVIGLIRNNNDNNNDNNNLPPAETSYLFPFRPEVKERLVNVDTPGLDFFALEAFLKATHSIKESNAEKKRNIRKALVLAKVEQQGGSMNQDRGGSINQD